MRRMLGGLVMAAFLPLLAGPIIRGTGGGGGGVPAGSAGGDLGGSYPNPTVTSVADVSAGTLGVANGGTGQTFGPSGPYMGSQTFSRRTSFATAVATGTTVAWRSFGTDSAFVGCATNLGGTPGPSSSTAVGAVCDTTASTGNAQTWNSTTFKDLWWSAAPAISWVIWLNSNALASARIWTGAASGDISAHAPPGTSAGATTLRYIGVAADTAVASGHFLCCAGNGTNDICTDSGKTPTSASFWLSADLSVAGTETCTVYNWQTGALIWQWTNTGDLPSGTNLGGPVASITTLSNTAREMVAAKWELTQF